MARGYQGPSLGLERGEGDLSKLDEINKVRKSAKKAIVGFENQARQQLNHLRKAKEQLGED